MGLISSGISWVRAFELPCGIRDGGAYYGAPRMALVRWKASSQLSDILFQVYVNGCFAGATIDLEQRQMIVPLPMSFETAVRIEVYAVDPAEADTDFSGELEQRVGDSGRVRIVLLRSQALPVGSTADIYFDNATGVIDYSEPISDQPIRIWPAWGDKGGFGMSRFGFSDFGYDGSAAVGFGKGSFGNGEFGFDADTIEWISPLLPDGVYKFWIVVRDAVGRQSGATETETVTVTRAARPAQGLSIDAFDTKTNVLVLKIKEQGENNG